MDRLYTWLIGASGGVQILSEMRGRLLDLCQGIVGIDELKKRLILIVENESDTKTHR